MTVELRADGVVVLEGACPNEDAEQLLQLLLESPGVAVDWQACESAHTAVIQVLLAAKPALRWPPKSQFLAARVDRKSVV